MASWAIEEMSWKEFERLRKENDTILIPACSVEAEGPHLPMAVDSLVAFAVAKKVAEKNHLLVGPLISIGYSEWHMGFPGTFSLSPSTLSQILREICVDLINYGFKRIFFINAHVGNDAPITTVANELTRKSLARVGMVSLWNLANEMGKDIPELQEKKFLPAGEIMTSVVMALRPDLVDMKKAQREYMKPLVDSFVPKGTWQTQFKSYSVNVYHLSTELTKSGVMGNPLEATKEKGEKIITAWVEYIESFLKEFGKLPIPQTP